MMNTTIMNNQMTISACRKEAAKNGMTFKECSATLNDHKLYKFVNRKTSTVLVDNMTLANAYDNVCSGYISSLND